MEQLSKNELLKYVSVANEYLKKRYPNGVNFDTICKEEINSLRLYLKLYEKNLHNGKIRYNSVVKKARIEWFILETIEKIMKMNKLEKVENLDFCLTTGNQIDLFLDYLKTEQYQSYIDIDELEI